MMTLDVQPCSLDHELGTTSITEDSKVITLYCATGKRCKENRRPIDAFILLDCLHGLNQLIKFLQIEELCVPLNRFLRYGMHSDQLKKTLRYVVKTKSLVFKEN